VYFSTDSAEASTFIHNDRRMIVYEANNFNSRDEESHSKICPECHDNIL
jgi:hypothetical protein